MYYYIINPAAGGGKINKIQDKLKERLIALGIAGEFEKSTGSNDIPKLIAIALRKGFKTIVAVGGDGTINEVINTIHGQTNIALGIIPTGNTNELANLLGIPDWQSACNILAARKVESVDLGIINDRYFVTSSSIGLDNVIYGLKKFQTPSRFARSLYTVKLSTAIKRFKPITLNIDFDKKFNIKTECLNLSISNGRFVNYLPKASKPQDGILDAILIHNLSFKETLLYGQGKISFKKAETDKVSVFHAKNITISSREPLDVSADGQVITKTPVKINISDQKLKVIVSRKRKF